MNRREMLMLKQIAWNTFKTTGNINTMLELLEVDKTFDNIKKSKDNKNIQNINFINNKSNYFNLNKDVKKEVKKWEL